VIDVSAAPAIYQGTGGGSAGSIYLECDLLTGKGDFGSMCFTFSVENYFD